MIFLIQLWLWSGIALVAFDWVSENNPPTFGFILWAFVCGPVGILAFLFYWLYMEYIDIQEVDHKRTKRK